MEIHVHYHLESHAGHNQAEVAQPAYKQDDAMLFKTLSEKIKQLAEAKSHSTLCNYQTAVRSLKGYLKEDMPLSSVTPEHLLGYQRWLRERNISLNTVSCYMRSLRSLMEKGQKPLFDEVFTGSTTTEKRSVSLGCLRKLKALQLPQGSFLELARDVFLFSFYAMGMPFVDVAHLQWSQISGNQLTYYRRKTGQKVVVKLEPVMLQLLRRYHKADSERAFPLLNDGTPAEYDLVLARYNRNLRTLADMAGVRNKLTSYVVRHTWASTAFRLNVGLNVISQALGHTNTKTTMIYISELDSRKMASANHKIIEELED